MSNHQALSQAKFAWTCLILQICFGILFVLLVRYSESADARHTENQKGKDLDLKHNLEKYPAILDGKINCHHQNFRLFIKYKFSSHDVGGWLRIPDDLPQTLWIFCFGNDTNDCGHCDRMEHSLVGLHQDGKLHYSSKYDGVN